MFEDRRKMGCVCFGTQKEGKKLATWDSVNIGQELEVLGFTDPLLCQFLNV